jgi:hypothetical protein
MASRGANAAAREGRPLQRPRRLRCICDAILLFLHLNLGRATDADEVNQLRETDGPP